MSAVDDYLDGVDLPERSALEHIRSLVLDMVPEAEEGTSYGVPAMKYKKKPLMGFAVAKDHLSVYPFSATVVEAAGSELAGFELSKGAIRFSAANPIPDEALRGSVPADPAASDVRLA